MTGNAEAAPRKSVRDLSFKRDKRKVTIEEQYEHVTLMIHESEAKSIIERSIRAEFNLDYLYKIDVQFRDLERGDDACSVEITKVITE